LLLFALFEIVDDFEGDVGLLFEFEVLEFGMRLDVDTEVFKGEIGVIVFEVDNRVFEVFELEKLVVTDDLGEVELLFDVELLEVLVVVIVEDDLGEVEPVFELVVTDDLGEVELLFDVELLEVVVVETVLFKFELFVGFVFIAEAEFEVEFKLAVFHVDLVPWGELIKLGVETDLAFKEVFCIDGVA